MPILSLPNEILHLVFKFVERDTEALRSCRFVCKVFNEAATPYVFISLRPKLLLDVASVIALPKRIVNCVRNVNWPERSLSDRMFTALGLFSNLRRLELSNHTHQQTLPAPTTNVTFFPRLELLKLRYWDEDLLALLHWLLAATPSLKFLVFFDCTFWEPDFVKHEVFDYQKLSRREVGVQVIKYKYKPRLLDKPETQPSFLSILARHNIRLRKLRVGEYCHSLPETRLIRSEMEWGRDAEEISVNVMLSAMKYEFYRKHTETFDFRNCTQLRTVAFTHVHTGGLIGFLYILDQLQTISAPKFETVILELRGAGASFWKKRESCRHLLKPLSEYIMKTNLRLLVQFAELPGPYEGPSAENGSRSSIAETGIAFTQALFPELFELGRASHMKHSALACLVPETENSA